MRSRPSVMPYAGVMVFDSGPIDAPVPSAWPRTTPLATARPDALTSPPLTHFGAALFGCRAWPDFGRLLAVQLETDQPDVLCLTGGAVLDLAGRPRRRAVGRRRRGGDEPSNAARRRDVGLGSALEGRA